MTLRSVVPPSDPLIPLRTSLAERLAALRGVPEEALPAALLDIAVRRVGAAFSGGARAGGSPPVYVCPSSWEQLRHEEGGAGRPVPYWARPWPSGVGLAGALHDDPPPAGLR